MHEYIFHIFVTFLNFFIFSRFFKKLLIFPKMVAGSGQKWPEVAGPGRPEVAGTGRIEKNDDFSAILPENLHFPEKYPNHEKMKKHTKKNIQSNKT